jgi:hypothetical protein
MKGQNIEKRNVSGDKAIGKLIDVQAQMNERLKESRVLSRELSVAQNEVAELKAELSLMRKVSKIELQPLAITADKKGDGGEATIVALASDWHAYETVKKSEVNGLNEYNVGIARSSIETFFRKIAVLADIERRAVRVNKLVLAMLGDLMTNQLHRDQIETGGGTPMEEVLFLAEAITGGINFLLKRGFDTIQIPCCDGNHGRNTEKQQHANRARHSYEWLLYSILARQYCGDKRVQFDIAEGQLLYTTLYGRTCRWTHGDAIKYQGGVGGITIPVRKALADWDRARRADMTFFGHWHTSHLDKQFCANGSAVGYAPYSVRIKAAYELPQQAFMVFDAKRWLSAYRPIYVR